MANLNSNSYTADVAGIVINALQVEIRNEGPNFVKATFADASTLNLAPFEKYLLDGAGTVITDTIDLDFNAASRIIITQSQGAGISPGGDTNYLGAFDYETNPDFPAGPFLPGNTYFNTTFNKMMYFDVQYNGFLSVETISYEFGRQGNTTSSTFLNYNSVDVDTTWSAPFSRYGTVIIYFEGSRRYGGGGSAAAATFQVIRQNTAAGNIQNLGFVAFQTRTSIDLRFGVGANATVTVRNAPSSVTVRNPTARVYLKYIAPIAP